MSAQMQWCGKFKFISTHLYVSALLVTKVYKTDIKNTGIYIQVKKAIKELKYIYIYNTSNYQQKM